MHSSSLLSPGTLGGLMFKTSAAECGGHGSNLTWVVCGFVSAWLGKHWWVYSAYHTSVYGKTKVMIFKVVISIRFFLHVNWNLYITVGIGVKKKVDALAKQKDCGVVSDWSRSINNHVYWCASSTNDDERELRVSKWQSIKHMQDIHEDHSALFPHCQHEPVGERKKKWMKPSKFLVIHFVKESRWNLFIHVFYFMHILVWNRHNGSHFLLNSKVELKSFLQL